MTATPMFKLRPAPVPLGIGTASALLGSALFFSFRNNALHGDPKAFEYGVWALCFSTVFTGISLLAAFSSYFFKHLHAGGFITPAEQLSFFARWRWVLYLAVSLGLLSWSWSLAATAQRRQVQSALLPLQVFITEFQTVPLKKTGEGHTEYLVTATLQNNSDRRQYGQIFLIGRDRNGFTVYEEVSKEELRLMPGERKVALEFRVPNQKIQRVTDWSATWRTRKISAASTREKRPAAGR